MKEMAPRWYKERGLLEAQCCGQRTMEGKRTCRTSTHRLVDVTNTLNIYILRFMNGVSKEFHKVTESSIPPIVASFEQSTSIRVGRLSLDRTYLHLPHHS